MILELLGLVGIGTYIYDKYVSKSNYRNYVKPTKHLVRFTRKYNEINRVIFGRYITDPYDTEYFEFNCISDKIPAANSLRQAIMFVSRQHPPVHLRASCSICELADGTYQHRWMVCCKSIDDMDTKDELIYAIYGEYQKERILTR